MRKRIQTRETRAAYQVRQKVRVSKSRRAKPRAKPARATVVPWAERIAPTDEQVKEWDAWLNEHEPEFEEKYPGHFIAIWDKQVIADGLRRSQVYARVRQVRPEIIPIVTYIPASDEIFFVPSNFPVGWFNDKDVERNP